MKIIGQTKSGFIVETDTYELNNLLGFYGGSKNLRIGQEITVSEMYKTLYSLQRNKGELSKVAETLRGIAGLLELQNPVIDEIATEATPSEQ